MNNLIFIGFRGAGKTTLATKLAERLQRPVLSTDVLIETEVAQSISMYVQNYGWPAFRTVERRIIRDLASIEHAIIDCGGGVVEQTDVMELLSLLGSIVWVDAEPDTLYHRLKNSKDRPLLSTDDLHSDIHSNYARRKPLYERYSNLYVNTSQNTVDECMEHILNGIQAGRL